VLICIAGEYTEAPDIYLVHCFTLVFLNILHTDIGVYYLVPL